MASIVRTLFLKLCYFYVCDLLSGLGHRADSVINARFSVLLSLCERGLTLLEITAVREGDKRGRWKLLTRCPTLSGLAFTSYTELGG